MCWATSPASEFVPKADTNTTCPGFITTCRDRGRREREDLLIRRVHEQLERKGPQPPLEPEQALRSISVPAEVYCAVGRVGAARGRSNQPGIRA